MSRNPCPHQAERTKVLSPSSPLFTLSCVIWAVGPSALPCAGAAPPQRPPPKPSLNNRTPSYQRRGSSKVPAANPIRYQMASMAAGMKHWSRQPPISGLVVSVGPSIGCRHLEITVRNATRNRTHTVRIRPFLARFSCSPTNIFTTQKRCSSRPSAEKKGFFVALRGPPWTKRCSSRPFAALRGQKRCSSRPFATLRGQKRCSSRPFAPSRPFADKKGVLRDPSRTKKVFFARPFPSRPFATLRGQKRCSSRPFVAF